MQHYYAHCAVSPPPHTHTQVFHWTMYYDEPYRVYKRLGGLKQLLYSWLLWAASFFYVGLKPPSADLDLGMSSCYGDGTVIPYSTVSHVRDTVWKNLVFNRWERGDVLMIDNFRVSHGRQVSVCVYFCTLS